MLADRVRMSGKFEKIIQSDLPILDGLYLHLESSVENSLILGANDEVIQWRDLSGNNNHAAPPQPQYAPTYDGEMVIFNDAHALQFNQIDLQKDATVFFVAKVASGKPAAHQIISNNLGQNSQLRVEATNGRFRLVGSPGIGGSGSDFGYDEFNQAGARFTSGTQAQTFNYDSYGNIGTPASSTIIANQIGARVLTGSELLIGSMKEVIIYNRSLTNSEISQINEHIRNRYDTTIFPPYIYLNGKEGVALEVYNTTRDVKAEIRDGYLHFDATTLSMDMASIVTSTKVDLTPYNTVTLKNDLGQEHAYDCSTINGEYYVKLTVMVIGISVSYGDNKSYFDLDDTGMSTFENMVEIKLS